MSSLLAEVERSAHCSYYNQFIAAGTHTQKWPLCLSFTKAILNVVRWRTRGLHTVAHKGAEIHGREVCFCLALEGPLFFFVLEVSANNGPRSLQTKLHQPSHAEDVQASVAGACWEKGPVESGEWARVRLARALAERWEVNSVFSIRSDLPGV